MTIQDIKVYQLKAKYSALSEIENQFPRKGSNHKAYVLIQKRMSEIIDELEKIQRESIVNRAV